MEILPLEMAISIEVIDPIKSVAESNKCVANQQVYGSYVRSWGRYRTSFADIGSSALQNV